MRLHFHLQYNAKAGSSVVYCKQITKEEYQNDIQTTSQKAMSDLLETIIADKNMEVKEKKKRLKVVSNTSESRVRSVPIVGIKHVKPKLIWTAQCMYNI